MMHAQTTRLPPPYNAHSVFFYSHTMFAQLILQLMHSGTVLKVGQLHCGSLTRIH